MGEPITMTCSITGRTLYEPKSRRPWNDVRREVVWQRASQGLQWYAVHCAGAPDGVVRECLIRIGVEVFIPFCLELRVVPKRELTAKQRNNPMPIKRPVPVPLFPRYPFIHCDLGDPRRREAFRLLNVQGIVCDGDASGFVPALIGDDRIAKMRQEQEGETIPRGVTLKHLAYQVGELVKVRNGPFQGFCGSVEEFPDVPIGDLDETMRLSVLVAMFGRQTPVEMTIADIEKL